MKLLDFLFYYFVCLFDKTDPKHVKFKSHLDQAAYVLTICSGLWLVLISGIVQYILFNQIKVNLPAYIFIFAGLLLYFFYRKIYIKEERYNQILQKRIAIFNVSEQTGRIIVVIVAFSSLLSLMLVAVLLHSIS